MLTLYPVGIVTGYFADGADSIHTSASTAPRPTLDPTQSTQYVSELLPPQTLNRGDVELPTDLHSAPKSRKVDPIPPFSLMAQMRT
jgi:hypothetical protein